MYCTSSPRGEQYSLYCSDQRTAGTCTGTYRTRKPVAATSPCSCRATPTSWRRQPARRWPTPRSLDRYPHQAERRRLERVIPAADGKLSRLLDAYTDGAPGLDLPEYKRRREAVQQEVDQARARLADLHQPEPQTSTAAAVLRFADI